MSGGHTSGKRVLVVDDDAEIRSAVAGVLEDEGFEVQAAENGDDALRVLGAGEVVDLILLDMMMPGMDGWTFMAERRKSPGLAAIPVVIFSAYGNPRQVAAELNAAGHLRKPVHASELVKAVERCAR